MLKSNSNIKWQPPTIMNLLPLSSTTNWQRCNSTLSNNSWQTNPFQHALYINSWQQWCISKCRTLWSMWTSWYDGQWTISSLQVFLWDPSRMSILLFVASECFYETKRAGQLPCEYNQTKTIQCKFSVGMFIWKTWGPSWNQINELAMHCRSVLEIHYFWSSTCIRGKVIDPMPLPSSNHLQGKLSSIFSKPSGINHITRVCYRIN